MKSCAMCLRLGKALHERQVIQPIYLWQSMAPAPFAVSHVLDQLIGGQRLLNLISKKEL